MKKNGYYFAIIAVLFLTPFLLHYEISIIRQTLFSWDKAKYLAWGVVMSVVLNRYTIVLKRIYIFFHELAHASFAVVFSANIFEFKVGEDSGHIKSDKNNIFIRLAPYFMPWQSYGVLAVHFAALIYYRYYENYYGSFPLSFFLVGVFFSSTLYYHGKLVLQETSDIDREQLMLSFLIIFNSFLFFSVLLFYLLFSSEVLLERFYYLPVRTAQ